MLQQVNNISDLVFVMGRLEYLDLLNPGIIYIFPQPSALSVH